MVIFAQFHVFLCQGRFLRGKQHQKFRHFLRRNFLPFCLPLRRHFLPSLIRYQTRFLRYHKDQYSVHQAKKNVFFLFQLRRKRLDSSLNRGTYQRTFYLIKFPRSCVQISIDVLCFCWDYKMDTILQNGQRRDVTQAS